MSDGKTLKFAEDVEKYLCEDFHKRANLQFPAFLRIQIVSLLTPRFRRNQNVKISGR